MLNIFEILIFWQQKSCRSGCRTKDLLLSGSQKWQWYWSFFQWWAMTYLLIIDLVQTAVVGRRVGTAHHHKRKLIPRRQPHRFLTLIPPKR
jgi:hypothetical protein